MTPSDATPPVPTRDELRRTLREQTPLLDGPALSDVVGVRVRRAISTTDDLIDADTCDGDDPVGLGVREAAARTVAWLAEHVGAYLRLPSDFAHSHAVDGHNAPVLELVDQLDLLGLTLDRVYDATSRGDLEDLQAQLGVLRERYATHTDPADLIGATDISPDQLDQGVVEQRGLEVGEDGIPRLPVPEQPGPVHEPQETP